MAKLQGSWCHINCLPHVINLVCQDVLQGLKKLSRKEIDRVIGEDVEGIKNQLKDAFEYYADKYGIACNVPEEVTLAPENGYAVFMRALTSDLPLSAVNELELYLELPSAPESVDVLVGGRSTKISTPFLKEWRKIILVEWRPLYHQKG